MKKLFVAVAMVMVCGTVSFAQSVVTDSTKTECCESKKDAAITETPAQSESVVSEEKESTSENKNGNSASTETEKAKETAAVKEESTL